MTQWGRWFAALRYRWKLVSFTFLLATAASCWFQADRPFSPVQASLVETSPPVHATVAVKSLPVPTAEGSPAPLPGSAVTGPTVNPPTREIRSGTAARVLADMKRQREDLAIANDRNDAINEELAALPAPVVRVVTAQPKPVVESKESIALRAQVAADRAELARLQARYTDRHPDVLKAQDDLAEAQRHFDSLPKPAPAPRPATVTVPPSAAELVVQERRSELMRERIQLEYQISAMKSDLEDEQAILNKLPKVSLPKPALPEPMTTVTPAVPVVASIPSQPQTELAPLTLPAKNITVVREGVSRGDLLRALPLSTLIGCLFSLMLLVCVEALDKTIKGPELLQELLPADVLYLGSVGRMRD